MRASGFLGCAGNDSADGCAVVDVFGAIVEAGIRLFVSDGPAAAKASIDSGLTSC